MNPQLKQRWRYIDGGGDPAYNFIGEIIKVHTDGRFDVKVVSYLYEARSRKDQTYTGQYPKYWEYLPGQDAP